MIKNRFKKICKEFFGDDEENIIKFDLNDVSMNSVIDELNTIGFGFSKKMIAVYNLKINETKQSKSKSAKKEKKNLSFDLNELIQTLDNMDKDTQLAFIINNEDVDDTSELYKYIFEKGKVIKLKELSPDDWLRFIKDRFNKRGISISDEAIEELSKRVNGDLNAYFNEETKIMMYKQSGITIEDIDALVPKSLDEDTFKILNCLIVNDKDGALKVFRDLRIKNTEPIMLVNTIASNLLFMYNVKINLEDGKSNDEIAKITGSSTGRIFYASKNIRKLTTKFLKKKIDELYELERSIKHSEVDRFLAFEMFILKF